MSSPWLSKIIWFYSLAISLSANAANELHICDESSEFCTSSDIKLDCKDRYSKCPAFADGGDCNIAPGWMILNCPKSCNFCDLLNPERRCTRKFLNVSDVPAYIPGNHMR
jgi:hypothetical protein